ncbi:hypothetical protein VitviT2T_013718 [Vitis vinifera]|uniref:Alcohol dehydrogenase-like C-terminal domain-containing protein n=1 Tax=Vitis vinifera TaxID=29760 RepID=A0ABY9CHH8_VITVI|nr:hypothetical protein VitviT2T_013718 [Vitis vinifera]
MKAVVITTSGDPQVLQVQEVENPEIGDDEVLSRVDAAAINRTDTLQRKGLHPSSKAAVPTRVSNVLESSKLLEKPSFDGRLAIRFMGVQLELVPSIQIAKYRGARVFVTADVCINYKTENFVAWVKEETGGKGVDVILDNIGGAYFWGDINGLNVDGRLFIIGFQGGTVVQVNLSGLLARRLTVQGREIKTKCTTINLLSGLRMPWLEFSQ